VCASVCLSEEEEEGKLGMGAIEFFN